MSDSQSRRDLLVGGAALAAGLAVATATRDANAQTGDVASLNALLTAEYQAIAAYTVGIGVFSSPPTGDPNASVAPVAASIATHFKSQHQDHATKLAALITSLQGTPVSQATVLFTPPMGFTATVINVIKLAANLEKGAAIAYITALKTISAATNAEVVAAIGGVETQHFIVLFLLANGLITPGAMAASMANSVVPESFVTSVGAGTTGLDTLADIAFQS